ncbi:hypothetical protein ACFPOB_27235 [Bosea eneae]|uniref:Uncharacterized protein n=1 Tax=Bosea eneae TaxID=151454 RepID=A0ABW0J0R6_9HYPH
MVGLSNTLPSPSSFRSCEVIAARRVSRNSSGTARAAQRHAAPSSADMTEADLHVCKSGLQSDEPADPVDEARTWGEYLTRAEARGPGDYGQAMERIERRYRLPARLLWTLRYRPPKDLFVKSYRALKAAYDAERSRQMRLLSHELAITEAIAGDSPASVRAARSLVDANLP